jgi:hypothetical protein
MSSEAELVQRGLEVVRLFLESLDADPSLDPSTVECITQLSRAEKLTKTRLLQALESARAPERLSPDIGSNQ